MFATSEALPRTAEGVPLFANLPNLRSLQLEHSDINDKDMEWVGRLSQLEAINIADTSVTDDSGPQAVDHEVVRLRDRPAARETSSKGLARPQWRADAAPCLMALLS
jgi:hypothetical protein